MPKSWREQIGGWIATALDEGRRQGLKGKDLATYVRDRTYTGEAVAGRWGLKVWREEFRHQVKEVPRPNRHGPRPRPLPGQGVLFDVGSGGPGDA